MPLTVTFVQRHFGKIGSGSFIGPFDAATIQQKVNTFASYANASMDLHTYLDQTNVTNASNLTNASMDLVNDKDYAIFKGKLKLAIMEYVQVNNQWYYQIINRYIPGMFNYKVTLRKTVENYNDRIIPIGIGALAKKVPAKI